MISEFITSSNNATTDEQLFGLLDGTFKCIGLDAGYAYGALTHFDTYDFKSPLPRPAVTTTYSMDWIQRYAEKNYASIDPTVAMAPKAPGPFQWKDLKITNEEQQAFINEATYEADLKQGHCIPLHGPYGDTFAISAASTEDDPLDPNELSQLFLICAQFHQRFIQLNLRSQKDVNLTPRQSECLHWVAAGKSNWDIGMIMGISERTVRFHLEKAFEVLSVTSREEAVVKAIMLGLISP